MFISNMWNGTTEETAFTQGESYLVESWIGWDSVQPINYFLHVNMHPSDHGTEFVFCLVWKNKETGDAGHTFDSREAAKIVPKIQRLKMLEILLKITERMVRSCNRDMFYMVTYLPGLPTAALVKYGKLCQIFELCGYDCVMTEPEPGSYFWRATKRLVQ